MYFTTGLLFCPVIKHLKSLNADSIAACKTLGVHIVICIAASMIVILKLMIKTRNACCSEARLCKCGRVGSTAERRNPALFARNIQFFCCFHKKVGDVLIGFNGTVKVAIIRHKIFRVMNCIIRENKCGNVVKLSLVSLAPSFCSAKAGFLRPCKDNAYLCVFKLDAVILESLENCNTHIAARKVIVGTVNNAVLFHIQ